MSTLPKNDSIVIRDVWNYNLEDEFKFIRDVVDDYRYIAMDTEFPGVVVSLTRDFKSASELAYQNMKTNVNLMHLIQLGLTLSDEKGNLPTCGSGKQCLWQFNFREFDPDVHICFQDSIDLLKKSGINFAKNKEVGVDARKFSELLMTSGVVLNDEVVWVTFHGGSDFGYLLKMLTGRRLPDSQEEFFKLIKIFFPVLYDIKHLMKYCNSLYGGLSRLAEVLELERVGTCHQAGSDSLLTSCAYIKLKANFFNGSPRKYAGVLFGLGVEN